MDTRLSQALEAINRKDYSRARTILRGYVMLQPHNAEGWLWLSRIAETPAEKAECLKRVAQITSPIKKAASVPATRVQPKPPAPVKTAPRPTPMVARPAPAPRVAPVAPPKPLTPTTSTTTMHASVGHAAVTNAELGLQAAAPVLRIIKGGIFVLALLFFVAIGISTVPVFMGNRSLVIMSGSMEPEMPVGSVVILHPIPSKELEVGDVIAFTTEADSKMPTVHRIVSIRVKNNLRYYTTQGDANRTADPGEINLPATAWRVGYAIPLVGYLISFAVSVPGIFTLILLPLGLLGILSLWEELRKRKLAFTGLHPFS